MRRHMLRLRSQKGIPADVRQRVCALVSWMRSDLQCDHNVIVFQVRAAGISAGEGDAFGAFTWPQRSSKGYSAFLWITVAAGVVDWLVECGFNRDDAINQYLHTILHEWAHYEQWRDGKAPTERGVNRRATSLMKEFTKITPAPEAGR